MKAATFEIIIDLEDLRPDPALRSPAPGSRRGPSAAVLHAPWPPWRSCPASSAFPASTLRDRLRKLTERGLVDSVPHHLSVLGTRPQRRHFPKEKGVTAAGAATKGRAHMLWAYPVSEQWFRLLAERLDAVAMLYRVAAMAADADPLGDPVRVDHYRHRSLRHAAHTLRRPLHRPAFAREQPCPRPGSATASGASSGWTAATRPSSPSC